MSNIVELGSHKRLAFARALAAAREHASFSPEVLGDLVGLDPQHIRDVEAGRRGPFGHETCHLVEEALAVDLCEPNFVSRRAWFPKPEKLKLDMLLSSNGHACGCGATILRGHAVWAKPISNSKAFHVRCMECAAKELLPLYDLANGSVDP